MSRFIVVEGIDGAGKSTLVQLLGKALQEDGYQVLTTREPGGTPKAEKIREFLLSTDGALIPPIEQLRLVHEGRRDHVVSKILPALEAEVIVISDRYEMSSWVYQVFENSEQLAEEFFEMQTELQGLLGAVIPEYIFLDLPDIEVEKRLQLSNKLNHFNATSLSAIAKRRTAYHDAVKKVPNIIYTVDATLPAEEVLKKSREILGL